MQLLRVSGEQVLMPLREIRACTPPHQHLSFPPAAIHDPSIYLLFSPMLVFDPHSSRSFLSFLALLLPTQPYVQFLPPDSSSICANVSPLFLSRSCPSQLSSCSRKPTNTFNLQVLITTFIMWCSYICIHA